VETRLDGKQKACWSGNDQFKCAWMSIVDIAELMAMGLRAKERFARRGTLGEEKVLQLCNYWGAGVGWSALDETLKRL
jgi:hypothetical protein